MLKERNDDLPSAREKLVIFDCDGVLAHDKASWRAFHEAMDTVPHQEEYSELFSDGEIGMQEWSELTVNQWEGEPVSKLNEALEKASAVDGFEETLHRLEELGFIVCIVSAGIIQYIEALTNDVPVDVIVSNHIETRDGVLTGQADIQVVNSNKHEWFTQLTQRYDIPESNVVLIGDTADDLQKVHPSNLSIAFDPETDTAVNAADSVITSPSLDLVLEPIESWMPSQ